MKQKEINEKVLSFITEWNKYADEHNYDWTYQQIKAKKLRSCQAEVIETPRYFLLRSYRTIVAGIDKETNTLYDFLRYVYGYTSTSAQHIAKFANDFLDRTRLQSRLRFYP